MMTGTTSTAEITKKQNPGCQSTVAVYTLLNNTAATTEHRTSTDAIPEKSVPARRQ